MKIYLGGGRNAYERGGLGDMYDVVGAVLKTENVKQVLHIPFARTGIRKEISDSFSPDKFSKHLEQKGIEYLCGLYYEDIEKFNGDTIYINGGNNTNYLMEQCSKDVLKNALGRARLVIGESAGAMIFGEYFDSSDGDGRKKGFGIVKNTIIEPHYVKSNREKRLREGLNEYSGTVGLGIDETTFVVYENNTYGDVFGPGGVHHVTI